MISFENTNYGMPIILAGSVVLITYILYKVWKWRQIRTYRSLLMQSGTRVWIRSLLTGLAIILITLSLLGPQWGTRQREVQSEGSDVLIALDVSASMYAKDIQPNRLTRAKEAVSYIVRTLQGDRAGLIVFAGDAFLLCPLTADMGAFSMFLDSADNNSISVQGTNFSALLDQAKEVFAKKRLTDRILVIITDGEDHEGAFDTALSDLQDMSISVVTLGVGSSKGGSIPVDRKGEYVLRDSDNTVVKTRLNPENLTSISNKTGGYYLDISRSLRGMDRLFKRIDASRGGEGKKRVVDEPISRYNLFLGLVVLLLILEMILPDLKKQRVAKK